MCRGCGRSSDNHDCQNIEYKPQTIYYEPESFDLSGPHHLCRQTWDLHIYFHSVSSKSNHMCCDLSLISCTFLKRLIKWLFDRCDGLFDRWRLFSFFSMCNRLFSRSSLFSSCEMFFVYDRLCSCEMFFATKLMLLRCLACLVSRPIYKAFKASWFRESLLVKIQSSIVAQWPSDTSQLFERTRCPKRVLGQLWPTSQKCVCVCPRCFPDTVSNKVHFWHFNFTNEESCFKFEVVTASSKGSQGSQSSQSTSGWRQGRVEIPGWTRWCT